MRIIARKTLIEFYTAYPDSRKQLEAWYAEVKTAQWKSFADIKLKYRSADAIAGNRVIFNICGNKFRLIVKIHYTAAIVYIRFIGTHSMYDRIEASEV